jgi:hypothetical protein
VRVLADYLAARAAARPPAAGGDAAVMPRAVIEPFSRMTAVRVLSFLDRDGHPQAVPVLSLQPAGPQALVCAHGLAADALSALLPGDPVAASLLTLDVISFQAKGRWLGSRRVLGRPVGALSVSAVYAGGPPIPGGQVV